MKYLIFISLIFLICNGCKVSDEFSDNDIPISDNEKTDMSQTDSDKNSENENKTDDLELSDDFNDHDSPLTDHDSPLTDHDSADEMTDIDSQTSMDFDETADEDSDSSICPTVEKPVSPSEDPQALCLISEFVNQRIMEDSQIISFTATLRKNLR